MQGFDKNRLNAATALSSFAIKFQSFLNRGLDQDFFRLKLKNLLVFLDLNLL